MRNSIDNYGNGQQHSRQWSKAWELSNGSSACTQGIGSPFIPAELDIAGVPSLSCHRLMPSHLQTDVDSRAAPPLAVRVRL